MNGDALTLRPESTAGVVRAAIEHNLTYEGPTRLWYVGPMFRHEKPQRGRYRQFHQVGAEALGFGGPDVDAELIIMCQRLWDDLGLQDIRLEVNSSGDAEDRNRHRTDLVAYFEQNKDLLDADAQRRLHSNPLRILDTKNPVMQQMVNAAPQLLDYLGEDSRAHFEGVQKILNHNNIPFTINPRLVRGMDYYNRTVFEWVTNQLGAQGTVCAGGRYDTLVEIFGGKFTPACGFAMGIERLLELMKASGEQFAPNQCDVYIVHQGEPAQLQASVVAERLRNAGLVVVLHCASSNAGGSFKSQMKRADASGAAYAIIIGDDEVSKGMALRQSRPCARLKVKATRRQRSPWSRSPIIWLIKSSGPTSMIIPNTYIITTNITLSSWHTISKNKSKLTPSKHGGATLRSNLCKLGIDRRAGRLMPAGRIGTICSKISASQAGQLFDEDAKSRDRQGQRQDSACRQ